MTLEQIQRKIGKDYIAHLAYHIDINKEILIIYFLNMSYHIACSNENISEDVLERIVESLKNYVKK